MAAPRIIIQSFYQSRLKRIAMNIANELQKIAIRFDE